MFYFCKIAFLGHNTSRSSNTITPGLKYIVLGYGKGAYYVLQYMYKLQRPHPLQNSYYPMFISQKSEFSPKIYTKQLLSA
jgi:hypothetical protein